MELSSYARDQATSALLESGNYKQAIKNIDKKLKKTPKDKTLIVLKACALFEAGECIESSKICSTLIAKDSDPVTDPDLLSLLYYALCKLAKTHGQADLKLAETLWQNALKSLTEKRAKVTVAQRWASEALNHDEWAHFVKAANALSKLPDTHSTISLRSYYFWQAIGYHLVSRENSENSLIAQTNGKISVKMLIDALNKIPENIDRTEKPGQWISTIPEFNFLYYVLSDHQKLSDIQEILEGKPARKVLQSDFEIACFKFHVMTNAQPKEHWKWETAHELIDIAIKNNYDWIMEDTAPWTVLLELCRDDRDESLTPRLQELLEKVSNLVPKSRVLRYVGYRLDRVKSAKKIPNGDTVVSSKSQAIDTEASAAYFKKVAYQNYAINDTSEDLLKMTPSQFESFRSSIKQDCPWKDFSKDMSSDEQLKWLAFETNTLAADLLHLQGLSVQEKRLLSDGLYQDTVTQLVCNSIRLYKLSKCHTAEIAKKDSGPGDGSCRIAASGLVGLGELKNKPLHLIQAACLLAYLLEDSPYNFRGRLTYIQLLRHLNIYSIAWKAYEFLDVKEILHEDLGPKLFSRISTSHPNPTKSFDAYTELVKPLKFYQSSISKIPGFEEMALEHGNYESVARLVELSHRLQKSVSRSIFISERRRIARLLNRPYDKFDSLPEFNFPSLEFNERPDTADAFLRIENGPTATPHYADLLIVLDEVYDLIYSSQSLTVEYCDTAHKHWKEFQAKHAEQLIDISEEENDIIAKLGAMLELCGDLCSSNKPDAATVLSKLERLRAESGKSNYLGKLKIYEEKDFIATSFANWRLFHVTFLQLEYLQASYRLSERVLENVKANFGKKMNDTTRSIQINAKEIQRESKDRAEQYKKIASNCRNTLSSIIDGDNFVENILGPEDEEGTLGYEIYSLMGYQNAKRILGDMARGALESYDGILSIKVG